MAINKVEICGVNTATLPRIKAKEQEELFILARKGDPKAREKLIQCNLRLVLSVVSRFAANSNCNANLDDLFQIGCVGLIKAIDNFDISLGLQPSTYCVPMIIGEIRRYLRDNSNPVRVSRSLKDMAYKAINARDNIIKNSQKEPTIAEIATEIGVAREDVVMALDAIQTPVSLYEPVYSEGGDTLYVMDQVSDKKNREEKWIQSIALSEAMKRLTDRQQSIIKMRFFEGKTQMEVAREVGISQAQVSRLEKCALKSMRNYLA